MSYDIYLKDPITKEVLKSDELHQMQGGTYAMGGIRDMWLNVTWNYAPFFSKVFLGGKGIRTIYGMTGAESIPVLDEAISKLCDDVDDDYWKATEGNTKAALIQLKEMALMFPLGMWEGD